MLIDLLKIARAERLYSYFGQIVGKLKLSLGFISMSKSITGAWAFDAGVLSSMSVEWRLTSSILIIAT